MSRILLLHWNELSFPEQISADSLRGDVYWKERAKSAFDALQVALKTRPDCRISFTRGTFHNFVADRPFQSWLEEWLGRDAFRRLRAHAVQPVEVGELPAHDLECELRCYDRAGEGITRAHMAESWVWSLRNPDTGADGVEIEAKKTTIGSPEPSHVKVANIAHEAHFRHWAARFEAWGKIISKGHVISQLDGYEIIMYPYDHGYPHVHVHSIDQPNLNAKYRFDEYEPLTSGHPAGLDLLMKPWIALHRVDLMTSWQRCQSGAYPLKINGLG